MSDIGQKNMIDQSRPNHDQKVIIRCRPFKSIIEAFATCCRQKPSSPALEDTEPILGTTVIGTIYGYRKAHVSFCVQEDSRNPPLFLVELAIPTYLLVKEMRSGLSRIALKCEKGKGEGGPLFSEPVWSMYCNGRKVGFAIKRPISEIDRHILHLMQSVSTGAGVIPTDSKDADEDELIYMRATYERVAGSCDAESFHMINPDGAGGHEFSIFVHRA
eukprot:c53309_g1_i1 orf=611-1261(+)